MLPDNRARVCGCMVTSSHKPYIILVIRRADQKPDPFSRVSDTKSPGQYMETMEKISFETPEVFVPTDVKVAISIIA
jgi:hypothetical protein